MGIFPLSKQHLMYLKLWNSFESRQQLIWLNANSLYKPLDSYYSKKHIASVIACIDYKVWKVLKKPEKLLWGHEIFFSDLSETVEKCLG